MILFWPAVMGFLGKAAAVRQAVGAASGGGGGGGGTGPNLMAQEAGLVRGGGNVGLGLDPTTAAAAMGALAAGNALGRTPAMQTTTPQSLNIQPMIAAGLQGGNELAAAIERETVMPKRREEDNGGLGLATQPITGATRPELSGAILSDPVVGLLAQTPEGREALNQMQSGLGLSQETIGSGGGGLQDYVMGQIGDPSIPIRSMQTLGDPGVAPGAEEVPASAETEWAGMSPWQRTLTVFEGLGAISKGREIPYMSRQREARAQAEAQQSQDLVDLEREWRFVDSVRQVAEQSKGKKREGLYNKTIGMIEQEVGPSGAGMVGVLTHMRDNPGTLNFGDYDLAKIRPDLADNPAAIRAAMADPEELAKTQRQLDMALAPGINEQIERGVAFIKTSFPEEYKKAAADGITRTELASLNKLTHEFSGRNRVRLTEEQLLNINRNPDLYPSIVGPKFLETAETEQARAPFGRADNFYNTETGETVSAIPGTPEYQELAAPDNNWVKSPGEATSLEAAGLEKATIKKLEERVITNTEALSRLTEIERLLDPEFLTYKGSFKTGLYRFLSKSEYPLSGEATSFLSRSKDFRIAAFEYANSMIQAITGAQMSKDEAERIFAQMPDPRKDSPVEFEAAMKRNMRTVRLSIARAIIARDQGISGKPHEWMDLVDTDRMIMSMAESQWKDRVNAGADPNDAMQAIQEDFANRYGFDIGA